MSASMDPTRRALLLCAAHHQGGHSDAGRAAADALGVPFPIRMDALCRALKHEGQEPGEFYPWLRAKQQEGA